MSYSTTLFTSRSIAARTRWSTSPIPSRAPAIVCGCARSKPMPRVEPPISFAAASARDWSLPVTITSRPSPAYDCASSRPSPCVPPTTITLPFAIHLLLSPAEREDPVRVEADRVRCLPLDRGRRRCRPVGKELARSEDVIPRLVELPERLLEIGSDELPVALYRVPGDEDGVHVRRVGEDDDRSDRIDHRCRVDRVDVQQHDVGLLASRE